MEVVASGLNEPYPSGDSGKGGPGRGTSVSKGVQAGQGAARGGTTDHL